MRLTVFWLSLLIVSFSLAFAPTDNPLPNIYNENYPVSVSGKSLNSEIWQEFFQNDGDNWIIMIDPINGVPRRIMGKSLMPESVNSVDINDIENFSRAFIDDYRELLNAEDTELVLESKRNAIGRYFVHFDQYHEGIPVYNSRISLTIRPETGVYSFGSSCKSIPKIDSDPSFDAQYAKDLIISDMGNILQNGKFYDYGLVIFPQIIEKSYNYRLTYWIEVQNQSGLPGSWEYIIDAHNGEILQRLSTLRTFGGTITGDIKPQFHDDTNVEMPFSDARVFIDGAEQITDALGQWTVSGSVSSNSFETSLYGPWCNVNNEDYTDANFTTTFSTDPYDFRWTTSEAYIDETTAFYHVNFIHDWYDVNFEEDGMDYRVPTNVKVDDDYDNAYYSGADGSINFGEGGSYFYNLALHCDVLYHEYTHGVTHNIYPSGSLPYTGQSGALDEAYSDYIPATILEEPRMGLRLYRSSPTEYMRNAENDHVYPDDYTDEVHYDGMIATGAMWDIRDSLGKPHTDTLVHFARYEYPETYEALLYAMLSVDDDDGDITNGTPNAVAIYNSWYYHGIGPGSELSVSHIPISDSEDDMAFHIAEIEVTSTVIVEPSGSFLSWSNNYGATWNDVPLVEGETIWEFSAEIPPQSLGTDVIYYITIENIGSQTAMEPPEGPTLPHMFTIGNDTEAPVITHTEMPDQSKIVWPSMIQCDVTDNLGISMVECHIEIDGATRPVVTLTRVGETNRWRGIIDTDVDVGDIVNYKLYAQDASVAGNETYHPETGWHSFEVVDYYDEPFEYEYNPYITYATSDSFGNQWHTQSYRNHTGSGTIAYKCGSTNPEESHSDRLDASLNSPRFNLGENSVMTFYHWIESETSGYYTGMAYDGGIVELKPEGGSWSQIFPNGGYSHEIRNVSETSPFAHETPCFAGDHSWQIETFDLSAYTGPVYIRWRFGSDRAFEEEGWYIDDIHIETEYLHIVDEREMPSQISINAYPNPFNAACAIDYPAATERIEIIDITGNMVKNVDISSYETGTYNLNAEGLESGIYLINILAGDKIYNEKIVLMK
ncbi:MAG: T9SS type A sorting domain-containing protein [Candidatus Zixiibacteriota bacterium]